ncbi:hypothetical protein TI39_contig377g00012 [Zymoseptoria brevis]|uniref:WLM domain-containing protein n=1 Tax=Zymoseptoria brevis TaxID=1047168 RepID=A0A0F4GP88_9PEZI|nr:hypothetical protein TI39_contig377g00012 [Zymoseptoria brevis]
MSYNPFGRAGPSRPPPKNARPPANGVQRQTAAQLKEHSALFTTYEHLSNQERADAALLMLRRVASIVKPIMQKHHWHVQILAEFLPKEQSLLGLNINKGYKICIRLRYHHNPGLFLPIEEVTDTMLHELSHNVWGPHDSNFHKLWDELRDEHETLLRKGYTGEGFLSEGHRLGGSNNHRAPPPHELRRLARVNAEKRRAQAGLASGSGQRLGGNPIHRGANVRQVIARQAIRRTTIDQGCGSMRDDAVILSDQVGSTIFKTKAEEDDANNLAISKALMELMEEEEMEKLNGTWKGDEKGGGLGWSKEKGLYDAGASDEVKPSGRHDHPSEEEQMRWAMEDSVKAASLSKANLESTASKAGPESYTIDSSKDPDSSTNEESAPPTTDAVALPTKRKRPPTPSSPMAMRSKKQEKPAAALPSPTLNAATMSATPVTATDDWACQICTCINPLQFLACDACGTERSQSILVAAKAPPSASQPIIKQERQERKPIPYPSRDRQAPTITGGVLDRGSSERTKSLGWKLNMTLQSQENTPKHLLPTTSIKLKQRRWRQAWYYDKERESLREMWHHDIKAYLAAFRRSDADHDQIIEQGMSAFTVLLIRMLKHAQFEDYERRGHTACADLIATMTSQPDSSPLSDLPDFIAIDFEGCIDQKGVTELGLARLNLYKLENGFFGQNIAAAKRRRRAYLFGGYRRVDGPRRLVEVIAEELSTEMLGGRKVVLVGHSIANEMKVMKGLGVPIEGFETVVGIVDTCHLSRDSQRKGFSLQGLLDHSQIPYEDRNVRTDQGGGVEEGVVEETSEEEDGREGAWNRWAGRRMWGVWRIF